MENETGIVVALSIIAVVISLVAISNVYFDKTEEIDLSGIYENTLLITTFQGDVNDIKGNINNLENEIKYIETDFEIDKSDLKDLEEYANDFDDIDKNKDNINELEDKINDLENKLEKVTICSEIAQLGNYTETYEDFINCLLE